MGLWQLSTESEEAYPYSLPLISNFDCISNFSLSTRDSGFIFELLQNLNTPENPAEVLKRGRQTKRMVDLSENATVQDMWIAIELSSPSQKTRVSDHFVLLPGILSPFLQK